MTDAPSRTNIEATCTSSDTQLTHERSLKVLKERAAVYEAAQPACKGSLGLFLRSTLAVVQAPGISNQEGGLI